MPDEPMTVAAAYDLVMARYIERYTSNPDSLTEDEREAVELWLLMEPQH